MMKRLIVLFLIATVLCCTAMPALAADKRIKNEDYRLMISMPNEIIAEPCTMMVAYNVKNFDKQIPSWDYLENVVLHFPDGDVYIGHVSGKTTFVGRTQVSITEEMIRAGEFTVSYTLDHYNSINDQKIDTETGRVTLQFRTAPDSFSKMVSDFWEDLGNALWYGFLLILVFIAIGSAVTGGGILVIFHK